jgi:hypothetical protein
VLLRLAYVAALLVATTLVHAACTVLVLGWLRRRAGTRTAPPRPLARSGVLAALVFLMAFAAFLECGLWAGLYVAIGALPDFATALYFSLVTFTTLGYGDVTLDPEWRLLAGFEAANGIILFGWTTALIVAVASRAFRQADDA